MTQCLGLGHAAQTRPELRHAWLVAVLSMTCISLWGCTKSDGGDELLSTEECIDTPGWTNGRGHDCSVYEKDWCSFDIFWGVGSFHNHPEKHCCACGKARCAECNDCDNPPTPTPPAPTPAPTPTPPAPTPPPTRPTPPPTPCDICPRGHGNHWHVQSLTLRYHTGSGEECTGSGCPKSTFQNGCSATSRFGEGMLISVDQGARVEKFGSPGNEYSNTDVVKFTATGGQEAKFNTDMVITLRNAVNGVASCSIKLHVSCSSPLNPGKRFGPFEILAGKQPGAPACEWEPEPSIKRVGACIKRGSGNKASYDNEVLFLAPKPLIKNSSANSSTSVEP